MKGTYVLHGRAQLHRTHKRLRKLPIVVPVIAVELVYIGLAVAYGMSQPGYFNNNHIRPNIGSSAETTNVLSANTNKDSSSKQHDKKSGSSSSTTTSTTTNTTGKQVLPGGFVTSTPPAPAPGQSGTVITTAHVTAYGYYDNTPPGSNISNPVIHQKAGGTGTYSDPITIAVGHSIINGKDILDYPAGTKIYIPYVRRYFIVEDTCGDGNTPQNGPCHSGLPPGLTVWVDMWAGGTASDTEGALLACEDKVTDGEGLADGYTIVINPDANRSVVSGPLFNAGKCTDLY